MGRQSMTSEHLSDYENASFATSKLALMAFSS
jgi:hypothetical protein